MAKPTGKEPPFTNCSPEDVFKALRKLGGFVIKEGSRHTKVIHDASHKTSTIPRHTRVNRYLLRDFVKDYLVKDIGLKSEDIYSYLWC